MIACCVLVIHMGTHRYERSGGVVFENEVQLAWEVCRLNEVDEHTPKLIYKKYVFSLADASALKSDVQIWLGDQLPEGWTRRFHPKSLLGKYCNLELKRLAHSATDAEQVWEVHPLPSDVDPSTLPKPNTPNGLFLASDPNMELLRQLPSDIQDSIMKSPEFIAATKAEDDDF